MEELGVWWDKPDTWEAHFAALKRYKDGDGKGDPNCTKNYVVKDTSPPLKLGLWLRTQRVAKRGKGTYKISTEQIRRLEDLGVWWDKPGWEEYFAALERYKDGDGKGDPNCPQGYLTKDATVPLKLGIWLSDQRQAKKGTSRVNLSAERVRRLEDLGVWWDKPDQQRALRCLRVQKM